MQQVLGFNALETGLAYIPFSLGMGMATSAGSKLVARFAPRALTIPGLALAAAGMLWFGTMTPDSSYWAHLMPAMFITSVGLGAAFLPVTLGAVSGVGHQDAGIASALLNTAQQVGGAIGLAVLATVSTTRADGELPNADGAYYQALATKDTSLLERAASALTDGYTAALVGSAALMVAGIVVVGLAVNAKRPKAGTADAPAPVHMG